LICIKNPAGGWVGLSMTKTLNVVNSSKYW
jgi:hypothetical protein